MQQTVDKELPWFPTYLPRIPVGGYDTSRLWQGCHNSASTAAVWLACTAGLPPSLWERVSKFHFTALREDTPVLPAGAVRLVDRS